MARSDLIAYTAKVPVSLDTRPSRDNCGVIHAEVHAVIIETAEGTCDLLMHNDPVIRSLGEMIAEDAERDANVREGTLLAHPMREVA